MKSVTPVVPETRRAYDLRMKREAAERFRNFTVMPFTPTIAASGRYTLLAQGYNATCCMPPRRVEVAVLHDSFVVVHGDSEDTDFGCVVFKHHKRFSALELLSRLASLENDAGYIAAHHCVHAENAWSDSLAVMLADIDSDIEAEEERANGDSIEAIGIELQVETLRNIRGDYEDDDNADSVPEIRERLEEEAEYQDVIDMGRVPHARLYAAIAVIRRLLDVIHPNRIGTGGPDVP